MSAPPAPPRTLVAGMGNIFLGDDAFGVRTARVLAARPLPAGVEVADIGVRGVHLAYRLLDGYDTLVLVDATARGGPPGTLYVIEHEDDTTAVAEAAAAPLDGHRMTPDAVLAHLAALCAGTGGRPPRRILVVGCEPACLDEGMELSGPVSGAVPRAVRLVEDLLTAAPDTPPRPPAGHAAN
ncbi:hydrogenase maturation protease [Streptomyces sp. NPDC004610]|uniref:hydrogenase maturation protease n=1 Tax=unclassified Streptomyces TaxID=2593676 RepID=UPI0033A4AB68